MTNARPGSDAAETMAAMNLLDQGLCINFILLKCNGRRNHSGLRGQQRVHVQCEYGQKQDADGFDDVGHCRLRDC